MTPTVQFELRDETDPPLKLKSESFPGWMSVNLMPGWYAPSNRSMCTGQPLRINTEFESAFNRLYFPIPEKVPRGHATSHFIVFCDPSGMQHLCPIYAGRYSPENFCSYIEDEMTRISVPVLKDVHFSVHYDQLCLLLRQNYSLKYKTVHGRRKNFYRVLWLQRSANLV